MMASNADHHGADRNSMTKALRVEEIDQQPGAKTVNGTGGCREPQARFDRTHPGFQSKVLLGMVSCRYVPSKPEVLTSY
jgi:hypothetical protein